MKRTQQAAAFSEIIHQLCAGIQLRLPGFTGRKAGSSIVETEISEF